MYLCKTIELHSTYHLKCREREMRFYCYNFPQVLLAIIVSVVAIKVVKYAPLSIHHR